MDQLIAKNESSKTKRIGLFQRITFSRTQFGISQFSLKGGDLLQRFKTQFVDFNPIVPLLRHPSRLIKTNFELGVHFIRIPIIKSQERNPLFFKLKASVLAS